jgi:hypothetical protein
MPSCYPRSKAWKKESWLGASPTGKKVYVMNAYIGRYSDARLL